MRWSYGVRLLSSADPEAVDDVPAAPLIEADETAFPNSQAEERILRHRESTLSEQSDDSRTIVRGRDAAINERYLDPKSFSPSSPRAHPRPSTSGAPSENDDEHEYASDDDMDDMFPARRAIPEPTATLWQSRMRRTHFRLRKSCNTLYEFMTAPLWAALLSLVVACIRPLQHALDAHMQPVKGALTAAGNCSIPLTLVVLGAYFYTPPDAADGCLPSHAPGGGRGQKRSRSPSMASCASFMDNMREMFSMQRRDGEQGAPPKSEMRPGETKTVIVAVVSRMVITPLLLLPLMVLATKFDLQEVFDECVFCSSLSSGI